MKTLRLFAVALVAIAGAATFSAPKAQSQVAKKIVLQEGGMPVPLCPPRTVCE